jgi:hypothetical protein
MTKSEGEMTKVEGEMTESEGERAKAEGQRTKAEGEMTKSEGEMAKSELRPNRQVTSLLAFVALLVLACSSPGQRLIGPLREVTVISAQWDQLEATVRSILQEPVATPQPEPEFKVRVGTAGKFDTYSKFRIVFLIGTSQDTLIRQILGPRADSLSEGDFGLLKVPNPWVKGQFALIFIARDTSGLVPGLETYAARIRQTLRGIVLDQMAKAVYIEGVEKKPTEELGTRYAFTIDVPRRWFINEENGREVRLPVRARAGPERVRLLAGYHPGTGSRVPRCSARPAHRPVL